MAIIINGTTGISDVDGSASTPALSGTDSNTGIFFPAADTVGMATGGTERVRIDSSGNVGIGTSSPAFKLDVQNSSAAVSFRLKGGSGTSQGSSILGTKAANTNTLYAFGDTAAINGGTVDQSVTVWAGGSTPLIFATDGVDRMRINAGAPILCLAGGNTSATGTGIAFPVTQSASSDANTLDDYEEGTWTPIPQPSTGAYTSYTSSGTYVKIGKTVTISFTFTITNRGTATTLLIVSGFPFTVGNQPASAAVRENANTGFTWTFTAEPNQSNAVTFQYDNNININNNATFKGSLTYISA